MACSVTVAIQYSPWRWFRPLLVQKSGRGFPLSRNPVFALEMIQTKTKDIAIWKHCRKVAIQYSPWRWFRPCHCWRQPRPGKEPCRNPVFALEMIQTWRGPGGRGNVWSRNPVFALEMIQTIWRKYLPWNLEKGRNPVFALEMIQTDHKSNAVKNHVSLSQSSIRPGDDSDSNLRLPACSHNF